jgi:hypothetical protein
MTKPADDLEAVRIVVEAVQGFKEDEQQRIFRWAAEKLGLKSPFGGAGSTAVQSTSSAAPHHTPHPDPVANPQDIRSFVATKSPRSDVQFAATVAYYYQFDAPQAERKKCIGKDDLQEAARKTGRERFKIPYQTLQNAHKLGLLDKGDEPGTFCINTVGENLVAMTLPGDGGALPRRAKNFPAKKAGKESAREPSRKRGPEKKA